MTQPNTTQNKEELSKKLKKFLINTWGWSFEDGEWYDSTGELTGGVKDLEQFISQAHQSGIEEGARKEREKIKWAWTKLNIVAGASAGSA